MADQPSQPPISTKILLSVATAPVLLGIIALRGMSAWLNDNGQASEEVFRGDRLPVLPFPAASDPQDGSPG